MMLISPPVIPLCFVLFFFLLASVEQNRDEQSSSELCYRFMHVMRLNCSKKKFQIHSPDKQFPMTRNYAYDALSPTITERCRCTCFTGIFGKYSRWICKIIGRSRETIALGTFIQVAANSNNYNRSE